MPADGAARELAMFPLGTVLLPGELLPLHVFEPRYRVMVTELLGGTDPRPATADGELGIVLIERGHEVGGGDARFDIACLARVVRSERAPDGRFGVVVVGIAPVTVERWLDADPYPRAIVVERVAPAPPAEELTEAAARVRVAAYALAAAVGAVLDPEVMPDDPDTLVHRVASGFGVGPLDRQRVLGAPGTVERLNVLADLLDDAVAIASLPRDEPPPQ
ncbi:MAG TPA: LON peptidase substrate-binding domain-containing protein [Acidimicrobiia bacterium]|jgi:Lon protease-like protein